MSFKREIGLLAKSIIFCWTSNMRAAGKVRGVNAHILEIANERRWPSILVALHELTDIAGCQLSSCKRTIALRRVKLREMHRTCRLGIDGRLGCDSGRDDSARRASIERINQALQ